MPFKPAACGCGGEPAWALDERSAWKPSAEVSQHRDLLSAQRGYLSGAGAQLGFFVGGDPGRGDTSRNQRDVESELRT